MKFKVANIVRHNGESIEIQGFEMLEGLADCAKGYKFPEPVAVEGKLTTISGRINMKAKAVVKYQTECARCLETILGNCSVMLDEEFIVVNQKGSEEVVDKEIYTCDGDWLTVDKAVVDAISVALPFAQICNQDCKGFCPECGINLNRQKCDCEEIEVNPGMAKLKMFFDNNDVLKDRG